MRKGRAIALLPIAVFLVLYLGLGILFEYVMKIPMGFYNVPIVFAFLVAILVACLQNRKVSFDEKLGIMAHGLADKNIITMLLIFLTAGVFVGVVGRSSAESVAYFMLSIIPARFSVAVLFGVACFVSLAMGTSVGTITLLTPIAVAVSNASGFGLPLCVASVMGGSMFGDNLSFISDTTIAACNGQDCEMKDKFRENFWIALPAAIATLILILILSFRTDISGTVTESYHLLQIVPYILVLIGGIIGVNVFVVLLIGIVSGAIIMLAVGHISPADLLANVGNGASGMFETCMVAILVAALCAKYPRLLHYHSVPSVILPFVFLLNLSLVHCVACFLPWKQFLPHHLLSAYRPPASQPSAPDWKYLRFQILPPAQMPRSVKKATATPVKT